MCEQDKKTEELKAEEQDKKEYVPDYTIEYTEEELADYWGDTCSGE